MKELKEIAWDVPEETYRDDKAISYSTLSSYAKKGFRGLKAYLEGEKTMTKALFHGSAVDCLLTNRENFEKCYLIADYKEPSDTIKQIVDMVWEKSDKTQGDLTKVDQAMLLQTINEVGYGAANWYDATKIKKVVEEGNDYFSFKPITMTGRKVISQTDYNKAEQCVFSLLTNPYTEWIFKEDEKHKVYYQLKFKISYNADLYDWKTNLVEENTLRCMFDIIYVDYDKRIIIPFDLKTTSKNEEDFEEACQDWYYDIQATLYWDILNRVLKADDYFKDFELHPFTFIPINKDNLTPQLFTYIDNGKVFADYKGNKHLTWHKLLDEVKWHIETGNFNYHRRTVLQDGNNVIDFGKDEE